MSRPAKHAVPQPGQHRPRRTPGAKLQFNELSYALAEIGREFYRRGWALGTSGNFSAVSRRRPLRMVITSTGLDKSALTPAHFLEIDEAARAVRGSGRPSSESAIHLAIVLASGAGAVLHTHSVWSTIVSELHASAEGLAIEGYEMLKGLSGVQSHQHTEWLPILENSQDMAALAQAVRYTLEQRPATHGILLRRHGLYTWGKELHEAKRHTEILEFLLEVHGRTQSSSGLS